MFATTSGYGTLRIRTRGSGSIPTTTTNNNNIIIIITIITIIIIITIILIMIRDTTNSHAWIRGSLAQASGRGQPQPPCGIALHFLKLP